MCACSNAESGGGGVREYRVSASKLCPARNHGVNFWLLGKAGVVVVADHNRLASIILWAECLCVCKYIRRVLCAMPRVIPCMVCGGVSGRVRLEQGKRSRRAFSFGTTPTAAAAQTLWDSGPISRINSA